VIAAWAVVRVLAVKRLEEGLALRAESPTKWPTCPHCGRRLQSKGFRERTLRTLFGEIHWRRRVGRCAKGCASVQVAPLDGALGLLPHPRIGTEVQGMGCLLGVFVPDETASSLLEQLTGVSLAPGTLWRWVQQVGHPVRVHLQGE
jgi:hypothetical protein